MEPARVSSPQVDLTRCGLDKTPRTYESARPAPPALSPHALHVHPLLPEGSTRIVWASRSPVHSSGCVVATTGGTVRLVNRVDKSDKRVNGTVEPLLESTKATKASRQKAKRIRVFSFIRVFSSMRRVHQTFVLHFFHSSAGSIERIFPFMRRVHRAIFFAR